MFTVAVELSFFWLPGDKELN